MLSGFIKRRKQVLFVELIEATKWSTLMLKYVLYPVQKGF